MGGITSWNIYGEAFAFSEFSIKLECHDTKGAEFEDKICVNDLVLLWLWLN